MSHESCDDRRLQGQMKETPLLFTPENVRKVLAGTKTQTRRIVKPQPEAVGFGKNCSVNPYCTGTTWPLAYYERRGTCWNSSKPLKSPYGLPGDRLYVKEAHYAYGRWVSHEDITTRTGKKKYRFIPDWGHGCRFLDNPPAKICRKRSQVGWFKRSSLFMPRMCARLWLELTAVRVERVQEISEEDALAEGMDRHQHAVFHQAIQSSIENKAIRQYAVLWDSINGEGSWEQNPWVWCLSFRRITP